jgi:hypothetical protein
VDVPEAWRMEERFWLEGSSFYEASLDPECLMAFPGMGVLLAAEIVDSIKGAARWSSVEMTDRKLARPGDTLLVLGYRATGYRDSAEPYLAFCTSTYRREGDVWKLVQHQQTLAS